MKKKSIDDVFAMCDSRYALVNLVAERAREISEDAEKHHESLIEKPVNIVLDSLKAGRAVIVKQSAQTSPSLYDNEMDDIFKAETEVADFPIEQQQED